MRTFLRVPFAGLILALLAAPCIAEVVVACDPGLEAASGRATAYQHRGDRCEGIYALKVSSTKLRLGSFTARFDGFDPAQSDGLEIEWPTLPANEASVRLRAYSLNPRTYYRMDTSVPASSRLFRWPVELLAALDLGRPEIGVVGWTTDKHCQGTETYLPLRIHPAGDSDASDGASDNADPSAYEVVVVPGEKLKEIFLTVSPAEGNDAPPLVQNQPLGYGFYPAREPTLFSLDAPESPGLYRVDLAARFHRGGSATETFCFYHGES